MYNFVRGSRLFMKGSREGGDGDAAVDPGDQLVTTTGGYHDGGGVLSNEARMSSSATERQESRRMVTKGGQRMVQSSRHVVHKTTTMTRGNHKTVTESISTSTDGYAAPAAQESSVETKMITRHRHADRDMGTQTDYRNKRFVKESSSSIKKQKVKPYQASY